MAVLVWNMDRPAFDSVEAALLVDRKTGELAAFAFSRGVSDPTHVAWRLGWDSDASGLLVTVQIAGGDPGGGEAGGHHVVAPSWGLYRIQFSTGKCSHVADLPPEALGFGVSGEVVLGRGGRNAMEFRGAWFPTSGFVRAEITAPRGAVQGTAAYSDVLRFQPAETPSLKGQRPYAHVLKVFVGETRVFALVDAGAERGGQPELVLVEKNARPSGATSRKGNAVSWLVRVCLR